MNQEHNKLGAPGRPQKEVPVAKVAPPVLKKITEAAHAFGCSL